ncbi:MAG: penicillin-binding protein 1C [Candidatus Sumerlaeia bacterium]
MGAFYKIIAIDWNRIFGRIRASLTRRNVLVAVVGMLALGAAILAWPMRTQRFLQANASGELHDRKGRLLYAFLNENEQWCFPRSLDRINPHLQAATIAAEDKRFRSHPGVDPFSIIRAMGQNLGKRRIVSGASTLTMQTVKLGGIASNSIPGKIRQTLGALRLELRTSKDQILEAYLNRAPYGLNLVGCEAASRRYFGKPARELALHEAALLAALPKSPNGLMPLKNPRAAMQRRNFILHRMLEEGFITETQQEEAVKKFLGASWHDFPALAPHLAIRMRPLMDARRQLSSTIDFTIQTQCENMLRNHLAPYSGQIDNGAIMVIDPEGMEVLAEVAASDFFGEGGQFNNCRAHRSPGSTLKPFFYALALEHNCLYPTERLLDDTIDYGLYSPRNFDGLFRGIVSADQALRQSLNVPAIIVMERLGNPKAYTFFEDAGMSTFRLPAEDYGLGLALGNCEARLDELMVAYGVLANGGFYQEPRYVKGTPERPPVQLIDPGVVVALQNMLEKNLPDEIDAGLMGTTDIRPSACWKTGTSTGNHDAWTFVFNRHYIVGVWLGNSNGDPSSHLVGASAALPLAGRIFRSLPPKSRPALIEAPEKTKNISVCTRTGLPASQWCPFTEEVMVSREQYVHRRCDVHFPATAADVACGRTFSERWPGAARGWDLANVQESSLPISRKENSGSDSIAPKHALEILNPTHDAEFVLTGEERGDTIRLRSSLDRESEVFWYLNDRFLGKASPAKPLYLNLTRGKHKIVCMNPAGQTRRAVFKVVAP